MPDDKSLRLIVYLKELLALRAKIIYDCKDYNNYLWLSDIPKEKGCYTQAWGISEESPEVWIDIKKLIMMGKLSRNQRFLILKITQMLQTRGMNI